MAEPVQIPSGTVTLLFTDIEGSTRLWEAEPGSMAAALRIHDEIMRSSIEAAGGYMFKTVGDSFWAAFSTAPAAIDAALNAQRAIGAHAWPTSRPTSLRRAVEQPGFEQTIDLANALVATVTMMQFFDRQEGSPLAVARQFADRALAIAVTLGDKSAEARALRLLAGTSYLIGDQESAYGQAVEAVALARPTGDVHLLADSLGMLAISAPDDDQRAIPLEALECFQRSGDELLAGTELHMIYGLDLHAGQLDDAQSHLEEAVALAESLGDEVHLYFFRSDLIVLRLIQARYAEAEPEVRHCLLAARRMGLIVGASEVMLGAACCAAWQGEHEKAARLHGAADVAIKTAIVDRTLMWSEAEESMRAREQAGLRQAMGDGRYDAAYRAGCLLSPADAVELALSREGTGTNRRQTAMKVVPG